MKHFELEPGMLTLRGVFYPTGHLFLMFPTEADARKAERVLVDDGLGGHHISLLTPVDIEKISAEPGGAGSPLPSAGTELETVRHFSALGRQGHHALLIHAPSHDETEHIMQVLKEHPVSYGQKYRHLVIEDLVT